jgi:hypothetical protein
MKLLLSLLLLFAISSIPVSAQSRSMTEDHEQQVDPFIRKHNEKRAQNPDGLLFTVRLKDNRKQFHHGEVITLELSFAASKPETFTLDAATYDRSGRLHADGFVLDQRDGAVDPLADYFHSGLDGFMMGGLRGIPDLTDEPHLIIAELNEWQRIDKPGHYRLYVVSSRVGRKGVRGIFLDNGSSPVVSNVVEFDIQPPDKKWAKQRLNEIISTLSKPVGNHSSACRALRFLGTPAAVPEMRKRFRGDDNRCEWNYKFGLIGSPHRDLVIREMENAITLREQPITSHFISTLALLEFTRRTAAAPSYPSNDEQVSQWRIQMDRRRGVYDELRLHYVRQLVMAIPQKQGQARATSLQTLLDHRAELNTSGVSQWPNLLAMLPEVFNRLPLDDQLRLLQYQWKAIASPAMLPVLREVLKYSYPKNDGPEVLFHVFNQQDLRGTALRRLYELSPEEGRPLILEEIRRPTPRVDGDVLRSLPDETLPELNPVLLSNLEKARQSGDWYTDVFTELIERYATDEILSRVQALYEARDAGKWECRTQAALLAYFLRVAPSVGSEYLNKALATRGNGFPRCYTETLKNVAKLHMSTEVEDVAIAALDDEDSQVVSQATSVLAEYGSADTEKALWRRFEKWHRAMESRSEELRGEKLSHDQEVIEKALREALTGGQAWLSDPEKLKRVRDLCLTDKSRDEVDQMISSWDYQIYIAFNSFDDESLTIGVANCQPKSLDSLKKKLLQFPKGTAFKLKTAPSGGDDSRSEEVFQHIKSFLKEHGMNLNRELER